MSATQWDTVSFPGLIPVGSFSIQTMTVDKPGEGGPSSTRVFSLASTEGLLEVSKLSGDGGFDVGSANQELIFWCRPGNIISGTQEGNAGLVSRWSFTPGTPPINRHGYEILIHPTASGMRYIFYRYNANIQGILDTTDISRTAASGCGFRGTWYKFRWRIKGTTTVRSTLEVLKRGSYDGSIGAGNDDVSQFPANVPADFSGSPVLIHSFADGTPPGVTGLKVGFGGFGADPTRAVLFDDVRISKEFGSS